VEADVDNIAINHTGVSKMSKTAVQVDLAWIGDESQTMRIHAILSCGKLASDEMYFHLYEATDDGKQLMPGLLQNEDGIFQRYFAEWGYGDESNITFEFLDRPLELGQEVLRVDTAESESVKYVYRVIGLTDLLA